MKKFLDRVRRLKLDEIEKRKEKFSEKFLRNKLEESIDIPEFKKNLLRNYDEEISLILDVKTRSPGKRNIDSLDPEKIVCDYERGGAKAISVLTDEFWFGGSLEILEKVCKSTSLPILHKEFIIAPYQLLEGRIRGASAALI